MRDRAERAGIGTGSSLGAIYGYHGNQSKRGDGSCTGAGNRDGQGRGKPRSSAGRKGGERYWDARTGQRTHVPPGSAHAAHGGPVDQPADQGSDFTDSAGIRSEPGGRLETNNVDWSFSV